MSCFSSMGGAIAVHISVKRLLPTLEGLAVIDVVEGIFIVRFALNFVLRSCDGFKLSRIN